MDCSDKTAYECLEDYERYGTTVLINDGEVSCDGAPVERSGYDCL